jgi:predicted PurR-regulated permease PerM
MPPERVVEVRPRTVANVAGVLLGIAAALWLLFLARHVIVWMLVALFLALALNPAVEWFEGRFRVGRGVAVGIVFALAVLALTGLAIGFVPTLVDQVDSFIRAVPGYVHDLTHGRGSLGFLERKYHVVERAQRAFSGGGSGLVTGAGTLLSVTKGIVTAVVGVVTVFFLTLFMLLQGPGLVEQGYEMLPARTRPHWRRVGGAIYRVVGGYVSGNLFISVIAGAATVVVLLILDIPFALALGLLVAILDLIPLAGATLAAIVVTLVALTQSTLDAVIVVVFFIVYQQAENHILQPLVYGRTVRLSPLVALIAVLIGAEVAGVLGALGAIPIAGTIRVLVDDWRARRHADGAQGEGVPA